MQRRVAMSTDKGGQRRVTIVCVCVCVCVCVYLCETVIDKIIASKEASEV